MLRMLDILSMTLVLVALLLSVIAVETNGWRTTGMANYGLFEVCDSATCKELGLPSATLKAGIGCLSIAIFTWCATFVTFFISCYKTMKALRIAMLAFASVSWVMTLAASVAFTVGWPAFIQSSTVEWSYSFYLMWCAVASGTFALALIVYMFFAPPKVVKEKEKGEAVISVAEKVAPKTAGEVKECRSGSEVCETVIFSTRM